MPSYARRKDSNQAELDAAAAALGWHVIDTSQFAQYVPGWPDAVWASSFAVVLIEYKSGDEELTEAEAKFHASFPGAIHIVRNLDDIEAITRFYRRNA